MIKLKVKYGLLLLLLLFFKFGVSQETDKNYGVSLTEHYGFIAPHNALVNEIIKSHVKLTELSFCQKTKGDRSWHKYFNYPVIGVSAAFFLTGNDESLGNIYGVFPFVDFPLNKWKISWNLKFGYGVGYVEKSFNRKTNYKNLVLGSHVNALIYFNTHWNLPITEKLSTTAGITLTHLSNGSLKRPNLGINMFSANAGVSYYFGNPVIKDFSNIEKREKSLSHLVLTNTGVKEVDKIGGKKYMIYNVSYNFIRAISNKSSLGAAADFFYNSSLETLIMRTQHEDFGKFGNFRMGISGIYSLDMDKISMLMQVGSYLHTSYDFDKRVYTRIGTRYHINDKIFVNLGLKTHFFVADFIEYGIGYRLN